MRIPSGLKLEKAVSRDQSRPVLCSLYLRITGEGDDRKGFLEGTDSYHLTRIPVDVDENDTEGFIPVDAIIAARKAKVDVISANGAVQFTTPAGDNLQFTRGPGGQFPNTDQLLAIEPALIEGERWQIGLNPKFLLDLAESLGAETITLEFARSVVNGRDTTTPSEFGPSALRPITVRPLGAKRRGELVDGAIGLLMPIRVAS